MTIHKIHKIDTCLSQTMYLSEKFTGNKQASFKGKPPLNLVRPIAENPLLTLMTIDFLGMVFPRIAIDTARNRKELGHLNYDAGRETTFRELASCFVYTFLPGLLAVGTGNYLLNSKYNPLNLNTTSFIDRKTLDNSKNILDNVLAKHNSRTITKETLGNLTEKFAAQYLQQTLDLDSHSNQTIINEIKEGVLTFPQTAKPGQAGLTPDKLVEGYKKLDQSRLKNKHYSLMKYVQENPDAYANKKFKRSILKLKESYYSLIADTLAEKVSTGANARKLSRKNVDIIIRDAFLFTDDVISKAFNMAVNENQQAVSLRDYRDSVDIVYEAFKKVKNIKLAIAFGVSIVASLALPLINNWITRRQTGRTDFVGEFGLVEDKNGLSPSDTPDLRILKKNVHQAKRNA